MPRVRIPPGPLAPLVAASRDHTLRGPHPGAHGPAECVTLGSVVPMSRILLTGMSGTGKSSALAELGGRGYRVVDTGDPGWREYREYVESSDEVHRGEWLWVEERITGLLDSDDGSLALR